nr:RNA-directed DNA polymerase, eukaryota [Tanacetum cinerariifolium]
MFRFRAIHQANEGFPNVKVAYLGGLWVMLDLESSISKKKLMEHVGVASWFTSLTNAQSDFVSRDRIVWVDIEGVPLHAWSHNMFTKIGTKWGEVMDLEESNDDMFARKRICIKTKQEDNILEKFKIIVRGKIFVIRAKELFAWSPNFKNTNEPVYSLDDESAEGDIANKGDASKIANSDVGSDAEDISDTIFGDDYDNLDGNQETLHSVNQNDDHVKLGPNSEKSKFPLGELNSRVVEDTQNVDDYYSPVISNNTKVGRTGGSILDLLDDMIKVGNTMGYSLDGCLGSKAKKDWIRELNNSHKVSFLSIQETKIKSISAMDAKLLWGNYKFEYIFSEALGNSGGILCAWDSNSFHKEHHTISDNFVAVYGSWIPSKTKLLFISIYAPQQDAAKRALWYFISTIITRWDGECIVMGDFNELRFAGKRMGSVFNSSGANDFNSFISNSGLVDMQLEGFSFTWSHPSATKMSKLDRFLVLNGFTSLLPHISTIFLDKHLSDHRPILLREVITDYGASPFRFYHSWFELNGFDQMVSNTWNSFTLDDSNAMIRFKKKLQLMKKAIQLDQGGVNNEIILSRKDLMKQLQDVKYLETSDYAQKAKIQWAIEGDENSKFYHAPGSSRGRLNFLFPNHLSHEQAADLEIPITYDEIRAAVWDCGENKSPRPDGFTFEFFLQDPKVVSDFRPISLIGCLYKVVTKVLATRLAFVIPDIVSVVQTAFIPNRQILDGPFIINEVLSWCKLKKQQAMIFKADFAKAYDSVQWDFLDDVFDAFGFGRLKQGDLLAPFLFILVMESLHLSFNKATEAGLFKGLKLDSSLSISHLFYADDAVFVGEWSYLNITRILHILHCFSIASGLKINLLKSHILGVGVRLEKVNDAAFSLGCSVMRAPFKYLGVSVGGNMSLIKEWNVIIDKLHSRLSKWKCKVLSVGGRLTLLKSVLGSAPIYTMSLYKAPKPCLPLWRLLDEFPVFFALNSALLFRWVWRFVSQDESLWYRVISSIYGSCFPQSSPQTSSVWSSIVREIHKLKLQGVDLLSYIRVHVGNSLKTKFWKDPWIDDSLLCHRFPRVYTLEANRDVSVAEKLTASNDGSFRRLARGGVKEQQFVQLQNLVDHCVLSSVSDRWVWSLSGDGLFRVKDARNLLDENFLPKSNNATRWVKFIPIKVNVFAWKVSMDRLPTRMNLLKRDVFVPDSFCPICKEAAEDSSHLFFTYELAVEVSRLVCRWWEMT